MKRTLLPAMMAVMMLYVAAQEAAKVAVSNIVFRNKDAGPTKALFGNRTDGLCALTCDKKLNYFLVKINGNQAGEESKVPTGSLEFYRYTMELGKKTYAIFQHSVGKESSLLAYEVDSKTARTKPAKTLPGLPRGWAFHEVGDCQTSSDHKKAWIVKCGHPDSQPRQTQGEEEAFYFVYDEQLKCTQYQIDLGYKFKLCKPMNFACDNNNLYCLLKVYNNKEDEKDGGKANYAYEVLRLNGGHAEQVAAINPGGYFTDKLRIVAYNNTLVVAGYYGKDIESYNGVFMCKITGGQKGENQYFPFTEELVSRYGDKCEFKKHDKSYGAHVDGMRLASVEADAATGDIYITGAYWYSKLENTTSSGSTTVEQDLFRSIYVARISADGQLVYSTKIPNHRSVVGFDNFADVMTSFLYKGVKYFTLCDISDNANDIAATTEEPKVLGPMHHGEDYLVTVSATGELKKYATGAEGGSCETDSRYSGCLPHEIKSGEFAMPGKFAGVTVLTLP